MKSKFFLTSFLIILLWIFGFVVGRLTGPKPQPFDITLIPENSVPQEGGGTLIPEISISEEPSVPQDSLSPGLPVSPSQSIWHKFTDPYLAIRVRALRADSIHYIFKKKWFNFQKGLSPQGTVPLSLTVKVHGVAPDSIRITGEVPPPQKKNFSLILTCTTLPSANILLGYKNFILHTQYIPVSLSPGHPVSHSYNIGVGYHLKF